MSFGFENLTVYQKALEYNEKVFGYFRVSTTDSAIKNQLKRAAISIPLNIAEGCGRFTAKDKKNFYIISRGSVYECISVFQILKKMNEISQTEYNKFYKSLEEISKMLNAMINRLT